MFVLHVIARMNVGGTAQYLAHLVSGLKQQGLETAIATGETQAGEVEDAVVESLPMIRVSHLGRRISLIDDLRARSELRKLISVKKPDIIHTHTFKAGLLVRSLRLDIPVVHTFHGHLLDDPEFAGFKRNVIIFIEKFLASKTKKLVTVGEKVGIDLRDRGIGATNQFISIPPGVVPLTLTDRKSVREKYGVSNDAFVGGWLARFAPVKNPAEMINVAKLFPHVIFVMGGAGELIDSVKLQAPSNLLVLGWVDPTEFLSAIDFLVSTSFNEGMPVAFIEAQMAGIPVIATEVGSVNEVIQNRISGRVVPRDELTTALGEFLYNSEEQVFFQENAKDSGDRFTVNNLVQKHIDLYKSI